MATGRPALRLEHSRGSVVHACRRRLVILQPRRDVPWTHAILPSGDLAASPHLRSAAGRSPRPSRICGALSAPARSTWAAAAWRAAASIASTSPATATPTSPVAGPGRAPPTPPSWSQPAPGSSAADPPSRSPRQYGHWPHTMTAAGRAWRSTWPGALATTSPIPWTPCRTGTACASTCRSPPCRVPPGRAVWPPLPPAARSAAVVLSIFGPRNAAETGRILAPDGTLIIALPGAAHLRELIRPLGMIGIDQRKPRRLAEAYRDYAQPDVIAVNYHLNLDHAELTALVTMGPSPRHITPQELTARIRAMPSPVTVTVDLQIRAFRHRRPG